MAKTFLSIGTGPGIGTATAERFAQDGFHVVLAARSAGKLQEAMDQLLRRGYNASSAHVDAADPESIANLVADTEKRFGSIDVLHYNAAVLHGTSVDTLDASGFQYDLTVNIAGAYAAIRAVLPAMESRTQGTILLTGGGFGVHPSADYIAMSVGKAGLRALALGLFEDLQKRGIHLATVTLFAHVEPNSEGVTRVAEEFFKLHAQEKGTWTVETAVPSKASR